MLERGPPARQVVAPTPKPFAPTQLPVDPHRCGNKGALARDTGALLPRGQAPEPKVQGRVANARQLSRDCLGPTNACRFCDAPPLYVRFAPTFRSGRRQPAKTPGRP